MSASLFLCIFKSLLLFCSYLKIYSFNYIASCYYINVAVRLSSQFSPLFCKGSWVQSSPTSFFFLSLFSRFSLIPSKSASLYIFASFEVYLIAENNFPHVLLVLFQKTSTVQLYLRQAYLTSWTCLYCIP